MIDATKRGKKTVLILFPDEWVIYSPTVLNLITAFTGRADLFLLTFKGNRYPFDPSQMNCKVVAKHLPSLLRKVLAGLGLIALYKRRVLVNAARKLPFDEVIGADLIGLQAALELTPAPFFLSLEISKHKLYHSRKMNNVRGIVIQSLDRYNYLFGRKKYPAHYVQNAPVCQGDKVVRPASEPIKLILLGNLRESHGVIPCIESLNESGKLTLTLKGIVDKKFLKVLQTRYHLLISEQRLIIDTEYVDQDELHMYLKNFHVGLCFYSRKIIDAGDFNYISSPSGKLFNYYNSGLPVIGSNIVGLKSVAEFSAGLLLDDVSSESIAASVFEIIEKYEPYSEAAFRAAEAFDFKRAVAPVVQSVLADK